MQEAITKLEETLKNGSFDQIKADTDALEKAMYTLSSKLYQQPGGDPGAGGGNPGGNDGGNPGDDGTVYDADFTDKSN